MFQVPGLVVIPVVWFYVFWNMPDLFGWGVFFGGLLSVAQFSYFGEYLPRRFLCICVESVDRSPPMWAGE